jgi:outer membrane protein assembly factor BamD (BamD/ComL family)
LFDRIRFDDPTGELSDDATMAAAVAYFERGKYVKADEMFTDLRENFPSSQHQFDAHLLGLKAKMLSYEGADYDGGPLNEAEEIIRSVALQFPDKAQEHYEPLDSAFKKIRLQKAERKFAQAQYYDRRKEYRAARMHYEEVRRDYSDTSLAVEAESRLAQIKGLPDVPKQSLAWLGNLFPESTKRQEPLIRRNPIGSAKK